MQFNPAQQHVLAWIGLSAVTALFLWLLGPVLMPFVVAAVLAYVLSPLVRGLQRLFGRRLPRLMAVVLVEVLFLLLLVALFTLLIPILAHELPRMRDQLPLLVERLQTDIAPWLQAKGIPVMLDSASIKAFVLQNFSTSFEDGLKQALNSLRIGGSVALTVVGNLVLIPVVLFYLLADWQRLVRHVEALVPLPARAAYDNFVSECDDVLGQYLRGQLSVMALLAVYYSLALWAFGLELAFPIGVFTGLAVFVPYVGFGLGLVLAVLAGVLQFAPSEAMLMVAVVYGLGQLIESFLLTPRLVGERIGLHPLHVIFALMAFGELFGFVGVLVALPVSAVLLVAIRRLRAQYQASPMYRGI
ncbi:AI-2E family transporter [Limnohabitans sp. B9-3]|uniref:AI-2E family transporter n=1 Tax=Limnohabitans sp. B9-3 TaxID=1100707 RepID=UPI000C1F8895|nr:AI-2E family transporter [Limnohabitans sp. B9-3]PIT76338.1 AI-2E family transporter [Limnohabitans sp. B9-3]